jgi:hypothetical protein
VTLSVTGLLTEASQKALLPLIRRALTLVPGVEVSVDLTGADVKAACADLLQAGIGREIPEYLRSQVVLVLPGLRPEQRFFPVAGARVPALRRRGSGAGTAA